MTLTLRCLILLFSSLLFGSSAQGYIVGSSPPLDKIIELSDIIFKGTAINSVSQAQSGFPGFPYFPAEETQFKVFSILKGSLPGATAKFRHYTAPGVIDAPQYYPIKIGQTYLVCAKRTDTADVFQQLWTYPTSGPDGSVVVCANANLVAAKTFKEALCSELIGRLQGTDNKDVLNVIGQLDELSGGLESWATSDFDRKEVLAGMHGLMANPDPDVAQAALHVVGSYSPYLSEEQTGYWLNTVGGVTMPNFGVLDPQRKNIGGELYRNELLALANGKADADMRAMAIASLGLVRDPAFEMSLDRWLADPSPTVRHSATLLLADFPDMATHDRLTKLADDRAPEVRSAVAISIGLEQEPEKADILVKLLNDHDAKVRQTAAMSLLSFSPKNKAIAAIFNVSRNRGEFVPLFLNALALDNPEPYLDRLALVVVRQTEPTNWWGGETPYLVAWEILFEYLQAQPVDQITSGKLDPYLDAMEKVAFESDTDQCTSTQGLHHLESPAMIEMERMCNLRDVAVPVAIYAFYVQRGMTARAKKYRQWADKTVADYTGFDDVFTWVDNNPSLYTRK